MLILPKEIFRRDKIAFVFDVDGAIVEPNQHVLTPDQTDILGQLSEITNGAMCFLTNNDGRSIHNMYSDIPCVSEFGLVWRETNGSKTVRLNDGVPSLDFDYINGLIDGNCSLPWIEKETSANFVYDGADECAQATAMVDTIMSRCKLHDHYDVVTLVDSVEIVPKGACKANAMNIIQQRPEFHGKKVIMIGDSPADHKCMAKTGFGIAVGNAIDSPTHLIGRVPDYNDTWTVLDRIVKTFERASISSIPGIVSDVALAARAKQRDLQAQDFAQSRAVLALR